MNFISSSLRRFSVSAARAANDVVIVGAARTPIGSIGGLLSSVKGPELGATAIRAALAQAGLTPAQVTEVIMGNVVSAGVGQAPARQASMLAGIPVSAVCTTVNKVCASGMKSIALGAQSIMLGHSDVVVAGGFESMSHVPYYLPGARAGMRYGHGQVLDGIVKDGLWDVYNEIPMGSCAEKTAKEGGHSRADQDAFARLSYERAAAATKAGYFKGEVAGVLVKGKKGDVTIFEDEEIAKADFSKFATLKPAFAKDGTITPANASKLNDGGSAVVLMSASRAKELGIRPLARIRSFADAEQAPIDFPTAPAKAVPIALARAGLTLRDVHYHEVNEAFAVVALANAKALGIPIESLNVFGGGVSMGHPIGSSGCRIVVTLLSVLKHKGASIGVASICNGGGGATAMVVERLN